MRLLKQLTGVTIQESRDLVTAICDDGYIVKAYLKKRKDPYRLDWILDDSDYVYSPTKPRHLVLRKMISDMLNAKKLANRPVSEKD